MANQNLYKTLQEMMPDYIFGDLNSQEKSYFEENFIDFPDLVEEVEQGKAVFDKLDKMEIDKKLTEKTRNLSVKVNQRRHYEMTYTQKRTRFFMRYLAPMASLAIVAFLIFTPLGKRMMMPDVVTEKIQSQNLQSEPIEFVNYSDLLAISNDGNMENIYEVLIDNGTLVESEDASLTDIIEQAFYSAISESNTNLLLNSVGNYSAIQDDLSLLSEDDFQSIIEDLKNENDF